MGKNESVLNRNSEKSESIYNVKSYGAQGDSKTSDTAAIQSAIDDAYSSGAGMVYLPEGIYRCGTIELRSGIILNLASGAKILGSTKLSDYRRNHWPALILADNQRDISIIGEGIIDGNSNEVVKEFDRIKDNNSALEFLPDAIPGHTLELNSPFGLPYTIDPYQLQNEGKLLALIYGSHHRPTESVRPQIIEFRNCKNITVRGITLCNAANWVQTYRYCENLLFEQVKVRSTRYWNNDGIDLVDCCNVKMYDCDIDSSDDSLCFKSEPLGNGCSDIIVSRCKLASHASAIKFGTASHHGFRRIHISDISVRDTYRSVVTIQSVDGAVIDDITVERIKATNTGNAFCIRLGHRYKEKPAGTISNIVLRDIDVEVPPLASDYHSETGKPHNLIPGSIFGMPGIPIENVLLDNVKVHYGGRADSRRAQIPLDALDQVPENISNYPEFTMWGELPSWGAYIRHAKNITFQNVKFTLNEPDFRPAIVAVDTNGLKLVNTEVGSGGGEPIVAVKDSLGVELNGGEFPDGTGEILRDLSRL